MAESLQSSTETTSDSLRIEIKTDEMSSKDSKRKSFWKWNLRSAVTFFKAKRPKGNIRKSETEKKDNEEEDETTVVRKQKTEQVFLFN